jgi:hypothetical protein
MKTGTYTFALHVLGLTSFVIVWSASLARAQQSLEVPSPSSQSAPSIRIHRQATPSHTPPSAAVETIPAAHPQLRIAPSPKPPPAVRSEPSRQAEPILPAIFRGCWQGQVSQLDSIERAPGGAKIGPWTPKTYRLCYERTGDGPFEMTFTEAGVARSSRITNANGQIQILSSDGRTYATMHAVLHFDEYRAGTSYFRGDTFPVDEVTRLQADIKPDGMHVWGQVAGNREGAPWFRAWWHTVFEHVAGPTQPARMGDGVPE